MKHTVIELIIMFAVGVIMAAIGLPAYTSTNGVDIVNLFIGSSVAIVTVNTFRYYRRFF